jgi:hypothetical protein
VRGSGAAEHHKDFNAELVSSGNSELDTLLGGGLERGTNALLIGAAGDPGEKSLAQLSHASFLSGRPAGIFGRQIVATTRSTASCLAASPQWIARTHLC